MGLAAVTAPASSVHLFQSSSKQLAIVLTTPVGSGSEPSGHAESEDVMSRGTPEQVLDSIVGGMNTGNLDALMTLYEPEAAFASQPGQPRSRTAGRP